MALGVLNWQHKLAIITWEKIKLQVALVIREFMTGSLAYMQF